MVLLDATRKKLLLLIEVADTKMGVVGRLADAALAEPVAGLQQTLNH